MQIDYDYLRRLREAFAEDPRPTTDIAKLRRVGFDCETDIFVFHMQILQDHNFIAQPDGDRDIGLRFAIGDEDPSWGAIPLRLTAAGHEFLDGLRSKEAMAVIKANAQSVSISTAKTIINAVLEESVRRQRKGSWAYSSGAQQAFLESRNPRVTMERFTDLLQRVAEVLQAGRRGDLGSYAYFLRPISSLESDLTVCLKCTLAPNRPLT